MKSKLKQFLKFLMETIKKPEMGILPGQLAFFFVLSIIPLISMLASLAATFNVSNANVLNLLNVVFPPSVVTVFEPLIAGKALTSSMIIFYISAVILASNGTHSMIICSNTIYKFENKDYLSRRIKALLMTFILIILLLFVLLVPAFGDRIMGIIGTFFKGDHAFNTVKLIYHVLKYPLSLFLIYFNIKLLYVIAPDGNIRSYQTTYGSIFTTIGWILATEIYSVYVGVFAKYNIFYGSIANIIVLMVWVYLLAFIFVLGMALNSSYYQTEIETNEKQDDIKK